MPIIESNPSVGVQGRRRQPVVTVSGADPTANVTGLGIAGVGDFCMRTDNGRLFVCTATNLTSTITWALVGGQV